MKRLALLVILLAAALVFSIKIYGVWDREQSVKIPAKPKTAAVAQEKQFVRRQEEPLATYEPIVGRDLFTQERKEKVAKAPEAAPPEPVVTAPVIREVRIAGQEIVLFGILSRGNFQSALISNPLKSAADKRESRWVKIGDSIANLQVDAIQRDRITLREGNDRYVILMRDPAKPKVAAAASSTANGANRSSPAVISTDAGSEVRAVDKPAGGPGQTANTNKPEGDEYEIVATPFGNQRVRKAKP
jgi:hypothetical protein